LYGFTEPTEVTVRMEIDDEDNDIMFQFRDFPNYSEHQDMFVQDTPDYCLHPFDKDDVFGWEKTIKTTRPQVAVSEKFKHSCHISIICLSDTLLTLIPVYWFVAFPTQDCCWGGERHEKN
jgi:hypothetical protein